MSAPKYSHVVAIDPGVSGGLCALDSNLEIIALEKFVSRSECVKELAVWRGAKDVAVVIEEVHASPVMGPASAFSFGDNYGTWVTAALAAGLPVFAVRPQQWQGPLKLGTSISKTEHKNKLKATALRLACPNSSAKFTLVTCDAYLIARYAVEHGLKKNFTGWGELS